MLTASVVCTAVAQGEPTRDWEFSVDLDMSATGTGLIAAANIDMASALDTLAAVQLDAAGVAVLSGVRIEGALSGGTASTSVLKINSLQAFIRHNPRTGGFKDPDKRVDAPVAPATLSRLLAFLPHAASSVSAPQWRYDMDPGDAPKIMASSDNPRFSTLSLLQIQDAILGTVSPIVVEQWLTGTQREDPRFKAQFDAVNDLTTIWEAEGASGTEPSLRAVVSPQGNLYFTVNAKPSAGGWERDASHGEGSIALLLSHDGGYQRAELRFKANTVSWADSAWDSTFALGPRSHTTVITDNSSTFGGDINTGLVDRLHTGDAPVDVKLQGFSYGFSNGLTGQIKTDITVVGTGAQNTQVVLNDATGANHLRFNDRNYFSDMTFLHGSAYPAYLGSNAEREVVLERIRFTGVTLSLPGVTGSSGGSSNEFVLKNAYFDGYGDTAADLGFSTVIYLNEMGESRFENVYIDSPGFAGTQSRMVSIAGGKNILFEGCKFRTFQSGWELVRIQNGLAKNITFRNCTFENFATAGTGDPLIVVDPLNSNVVFDNCYFFSREGVILDVQGGSTFRNCKFESETSATATEPVLISAFGDIGNDEGLNGRPTFINCNVTIGPANLTGASATRGIIEFIGEVVVDGLDINFSSGAGSLHAGPILELSGSAATMYLRNIRFVMDEVTIPNDASAGLINILPSISGHVALEGVSFAGMNTTANTAGRAFIRISNQGEVTIRDVDFNGGVGGGSNGFNRLITTFSFGPIILDNIRVYGFSQTLNTVIEAFFAENLVIKDCIFELPDTVAADHAVGVAVDTCEQLSITNTWMHASENGNAFIDLSDVLNVQITNCQLRCDGNNDSDEFVELTAGTNDTLVFSNNLLVGDNAGSPLTTLDFSTITTATIIGNVFRNLGGGGITITYGASNIGNDTLNKEA